VTSPGAIITPVPPGMDVVTAYARALADGRTATARAIAAWTGADVAYARLWADAIGTNTD
jgi:threonine/homoserine/homoserine lactone efflux protein